MPTRILITSGLTEKDIGGPFQYGPRLREAFLEMGCEVRLLSYGRVEKFLPIGLRHIYFFLKVLTKSFRSDYVLALDTFSVGVPSVWAARISGRKIIVRVGGDYLWSAYVNRTGQGVTLPEFYKNLPRLNWKEEAILSLTRAMTHPPARRFSGGGGSLVFNTEWQRRIWLSFYKIGNSEVVRNYMPEKSPAKTPETKNFLWAGRAIPEKNLAALKRVGERVRSRYPDFRLDIVTGEPHEKILERIKGAYAVISAAFTDICPNFILEGISFNKPFVMTKETGLNEIYSEGGIFFDPLNESELEAALEAMLDEKVYNNAVQALKKVEASRSWGAMALEYLEIWKRL